MPTSGLRPKVTGDSASIEIARAPWIANHVGGSSAYRRDEAGPFENTLIDEFLAGEFDRRELIRRASILGVSVPGGRPAAGGGRRGRARVRRPRARRGEHQPDPRRHHPAADRRDRAAHLRGPGRPRDRRHLRRVPDARRARARRSCPSWRSAGSRTRRRSIWTFKLRPNVKFQTGQAMTADDVVATWKRLTSPGSQALSAVGSFLAPGRRGRRSTT